MMGRSSSSRERLISDPVHRSKVLHYVKGCRCGTGGYCFYRLDEPNAADTYHALRTLEILGEDVKDEETVQFLLDLQKPDGSYSSLFAAFCAGRGLRLLGERPRHNPEDYIRQLFPCPDPGTQALEAFSLFDSLHTWVSLHGLYRITLSASEREAIRDAVLTFQKKSGGFGSPITSLKETWQATEILLMTGYPLEEMDVGRFLRSCEDPEFGYLGRPEVRPSYLEDLYAGLRLSALLSETPRYRGACMAFLKRCRHRSGGYTRSVFGGIPTLEFTAIAVEALGVLSEMGLFHLETLKVI